MSARQRALLKVFWVFLLLTGIWTIYRLWSVSLIIRDGDMDHGMFFVTQILFQPLLGLLPILLIVRYVEKRRMCSIGLSREKFTRNASFGIFLSLFESIAYACLAYILLVPLGVSPTFTLNPENLAPISIFLMPLTFILVVGPSEEIQDRGYFQTRLLEHFGPRFSIIFTSFLFALSHIPIDVFIWRYDVSMMSFHLLGVFVSGCILGYLFYRTGVLTGPIFLHALVDTQAFAYAFEFDYKELNSEVAFGIEGLTWAAITALTFLLIRLLTSRLGLKVENLPWETATEKEEQRTNE